MNGPNPVVSLLSRLSTALLCLIIVLAPVPAGANSTAATGMIGAAVFIGLIFAGLGTNKKLLTSSLHAYRFPLLLLAVWLGWISLQIAPLPEIWAAILAPESYQLSKQASSVGATQIHSISWSQKRTVEALQQSVIFVGAYLLTILVTANRGRSNTILLAIVCSGIFQVLVGLAAIYTEFNLGLSLLATQNDRGFTSGTFVNRNHLAGYLCLCVASATALLLTGTARYSQWKSPIRRALEFLLSSQFLIRFAIIVLIVGVIVTRSRMGNTAIMVGLVVSTLLYSFRRNEDGGRPVAALLLLATVVLLDVLVISRQFGISEVIDRIEQTQVQNEDRILLGTRAVSYGVEPICCGVGLGNFELAIRKIRPDPASGYYDHAHNDYLEFTIETGAVGMSLLTVFVSIHLLAALRGLLGKASQRRRARSFGLFVALVAALLHATVEFNFQIPAYALTFMIALAALSKPSSRRRLNRSESEKSVCS